MENIKYIGQNHINGLAGICKHNLTKDVKATLKRLQDKYKITFTFNKQTNVNLLWKSYSDELLTQNWKSVVTNQTYKELYNQTNGINILAADMLKIYIEHNHKADYQFIWEFDVERLILNELNHILRLAGGNGANGPTFHYYSENLSELLNCNDYYALFNSMYGIDNVNQKAMKATTKAVKAFDDLLADIPNKAIFFNALAQYYQSNDLSQLHNTIHTN